MLPKNDGKPIAFKCTKEFRELTEAYADRARLSLSDYVRKAVEKENAVMDGGHWIQIRPHGKSVPVFDKVDEIKARNEPVKTEEQELEEMLGKFSVNPESKVKKLKEVVKDMEKPDRMVQPNFKGGK